MTIAVIIIALLMAASIVTGLRDIITEIKSFYRSRVMPSTVFQREGAGAAGSSLNLRKSKFDFPLKINTSGLQAKTHLSTISENKRKLNHV